MTIYIGIDPGAMGAISWLDEAGKMRIRDMPETLDALEVLVASLARFEQRAAVIERLSGIPSGGPLRCPRCKAVVKPSSPRQTPYNARKQGEQYGALLMALRMSGTKPHEVSPQTWQKELGLRFPKEKLTQPQRKARHRDRAKQLWLLTQPTIKTADSMLLAEYCRRVFYKEEGGR